MKTITTTDFTTTLLVNQTPQEVFNAINNVGAWWSTDFEGQLEKPDDVFTVRFGEVYITSKIVELIPNEKIIWQVIDCNKPWLKNTKEWVNTTMCWEISKKGEKTQIQFSHFGLVPAFECFEVCTNAWTDYLQVSLTNLITTGKGNPTNWKPKKLDFTATILVDKTIEEAFSAILNVRGWWSEAIEGNTYILNHEFIYHYIDIHYCKLQLIELVPHQKVVYLVLDNYFKFTKDKSEWKGTKLIFDISQKNKQTQIIFTHQGLVPQYECYEICREAWTNYISNSLYNLITTGKGEPNTDDYNAELVAKWKLG